VTTLLLGLAMIPIGYFWGGIGIGLSGFAVVAGSIGLFTYKRQAARAPSPPLADTKKLTYPEKISRFRTRLHDPQWRRYGMTRLAGNALGVLLLFGIIMVGTPLVRAAWNWGSAVVHAQSVSDSDASTPVAPPLPDAYKTVNGSDIINPLNTAWVLLGAFL